MCSINTLIILFSNKRAGDVHKKNAKSSTSNIHLKKEKKKKKTAMREENIKKEIKRNSCTVRMCFFLLLNIFFFFVRLWHGGKNGKNENLSKNSTMRKGILDCFYYYVKGQW